MVQMTGSFTQVSAEGYEDVLKALNVGFMLRKAATASTPVMTITEAGGKWNMITKTTMKSAELNFELGKEFDEETTDGRKCKTTVTVEGNKMITNQRATKAGEKDVLVIREFDDDGINYSITVDGVVSNQRFKSPLSHYYSVVWSVLGWRCILVQDDHGYLLHLQ